MPVKLSKVSQFLIFGNIATFYLVQGSMKMAIPPKIAVYRGNQPFHVKIWKILLHKHVQHDAWNDLELLLFLKRRVFTEYFFVKS